MPGSGSGSHNPGQDPKGASSAPSSKSREVRSPKPKAVAGTDLREDVELRAGTRVTSVEIDTESVLDGGIDSDSRTEIRANETQESVVAFGATAGAPAAAHGSPDVAEEGAPGHKVPTKIITSEMMNKLALGRRVVRGVAPHFTRDSHSESSKNWDERKEPHDL